MTILPPNWKHCDKEERAAKVAALPDVKRAKLAKWVKQRKAKRIWEPFPGPQTEAFPCVADVIGYGGAGGGGKTDFALGLAIKRHRRASIMRRTYPTLGAIIDRSHEILDTIPGAKWNEQKNRWTVTDKKGAGVQPGGLILRFGAMQYERDKENYRGTPDDLKVFDEAQNFTESQVRFVMGWTRTSVPGQPVTVLLTFNPPTTADGQWLITFFAPWLDSKHSNPARPGELRYFAMIDGTELEVDGPCPVTIAESGETVTPKSRTFFPARVEDNPVYMATGYRDMLAALPEPLRSQMLKGDFQAGVDDDAWQVIPTRWVQLAMERGKTTPRPVDAQGSVLPWTGLGVDVAAGGADQTVFARRAHDWYAPLLAYPGKLTPDGAAAATLLVAALDGAKCRPNIDVIGVGQGLKTALNMSNIDFAAVNVASGSYGRDKSGLLTFANLKAEMYWRMREALDPESGRNVCLPDDRELLADLCAARWSLKTSGVEIEKKSDTIKRLGRSPDKGEAVMLANYVAPVAGFV